MKQLIYTTGVFETELKVWPHGEDVESIKQGRGCEYAARNLRCAKPLAALCDMKLRKTMKNISISSILK